MNAAIIISCLLAVAQPSLPDSAALDIAGYFDPTGIADGANATLLASEDQECILRTSATSDISVAPIVRSLQLILMVQASSPEGRDILTM